MDNVRTQYWPGQKEGQVKLMVSILSVRPSSQPVPYAVHFAKEDDADSISLARSISKDSLASNKMSITPKHILGSSLPQHRLSGQSLLTHMRIEDEEEEIEEEELVAVIHPFSLSRHRIMSDMEQDELETQSATASIRVSDASRVSHHDVSPFAHDHNADSYYLEPLIPTVPKPAKEKGISENKHEESGESCSRAAVTVKKTPTNIPNSSKRKFPVVDSVLSSPRPPTEGSVGSSQSPGFFLHWSAEPAKHSPFPVVMEAGHDSDSDIADLEEDDEEDDQTELEKTLKGNRLDEGCMAEFGHGEVESAKLREDLKVSEHEDKEDASGRSSPCPSTVSWASSCSASGSAGVKMTSFAERKLLKLGLRDGYSSTSSSQKTTPDGSEIPPPWQAKEPSTMLGKNIMVSPVVPAELLQLHMQLEEQRRAIEYQKKKMEALSAKQRLKLGKAAFLNVVKKGAGRSDTLPLPLKHSQESSVSTAAERRKAKTQSCKDDSCLDALKSQTDRRMINRDNSWNSLSQSNSSEPDFNECSRSIDLLNQAISSIQQQMMQLSLQQDLLMKQGVVSPSENAQTNKSTDSRIDPKTPQTDPEQEEEQAANYSKQNAGVDESAKIRSQLIEVDLSELKDPVEDGSEDIADSTAEADQKGVLGFFFKVNSNVCDSLKVSMLIKNQSSGALSRGADLSFSHRGSTLSLATDADSVISGPKLFKEPSSKSNKPIIINAIAHCCLAGKVNEVQKNVILEELEKCESNHLFILFRDGGCQFRAIYTYSPDTEVIVKYTGTGPRTITRKMIDKLYKYNSDRKQFTVIPAKTVSVSVDALTIHNHLWQIRRPGSARRK
ncbi:hypothetical protein GOODEAATRI_024414 [Goodea atripinnis]|uniref:CKK domain-containing protein n=1 Tax=Goodea atripinnis TaxID=208336 RepID=A0ABV0MKE4_9TELE